MSRRIAAVVLATLALAATASARVISYAPYTSTPAAPGIHSRTSRYFVLIEGDNEYYRQVVLYDSTEREEPRIVYPPAGAPAPFEPIDYAMLHERAGDTHPLLLIGTRLGGMFSRDGLTWARVNGIPHLRMPRESWVDHGGPNTQPLWYTLQNGSDEWPFILQIGGELKAVDANGAAKRLGLIERLVGRDREGRRFLVRSAGAVEMIDLWGNRRRLFETRAGSAYDGWITPAGQAYIQEYRADGRYLYHYRNRSLYFIASAYDAAPPVLEVPRPAVEELRFFAVPTHDFNGAWMIQRQEGRPTTLLRHVAGGDLETMWSDPSGRQVEALIAGNSGETLLIQVHVPRNVATEVTFLDPALAVWRVGAPMPAEYDELYLDEEENKGFLHVDVDRIAGGELFVFNSGNAFGGDPASGPISAPIEGGSDVFQEWGVVRASLRQRLVLPGVTLTRGAHGSSWSTDVTLYNPLDGQQAVEIRYVAAGSDPARAAARLTRTITLAPRELKHIRNVLNSLFLVAASGGTLFFTPESGMTIFGRTYTTRADGGTYGYGLHAFDFFNAAGPRFPLTFAAAFPGPGFRTNVMLTDTSGRGAAAAVGITAANSSGQTLVTQFGTAGGGAAQSRVDGAWLTDGGAMTLQPTRGTIVPVVVAVDNSTNDPAYLAPDLAAFEARSIPMVASDSWKSDLHLFNAGPYGSSVQMEAHPHDGSTPVMKRVYVTGGGSVVLRDVLRTTFGLTGRARLTCQSWEEDRHPGIRVTSRLYTTAPSGGTYGTMAPALNSFQIAAPGDRLGITGIGGGNAFATNVTLVELSRAGSPAPAHVRIRILGDGGAELASFTEVLQPRTARTIDDLFGSRGLTTPAAARLEIEVSGGGLVGTFVTLVDRITGDPTSVPANLIAK